MESLRNVLLIGVVVLVGMLTNSLTHGRHLRKALTQVDALENFNAPAATTGGDHDDDKIEKEEEEAKDISSSLSSLKLSKIPHRIYVAGKSSSYVYGSSSNIHRKHLVRPPQDTSCVKLLTKPCSVNPFTKEEKCFFEKKLIHKLHCVAPRGIEKRKGGLKPTFSCVYFQKNSSRSSNTC